MINPFRRRGMMSGGSAAHRYERLSVGGWFAALLDDAQFNMLLTLMIVAVALNVVARSMGGGGYGGMNGFHGGTVAVSMSTAPVTSLCILFLIYLHFEETIRGKTIMKNWNQRYSFQPASILFGKEYHRLWTGQLLHSNKFHLYLNVATLASLGQEEYLRSQYDGVGMAGFACYFFALIVAVGMVNVYLVKWFKYDEEMRKYYTGFSGVVFALKTLGNYNRFDLSAIRIFIFADVITFDIPFVVPTFTLHFFELFIVSLLVPKASFWGILAGIVTGYFFAFVWNIKGILTWVVTGKFPTQQAQAQFGGHSRKRGRELEERQNILGDLEQQQAYLKDCQEEFKTALGKRDSSVDLLCQKHAQVLVKPYPTPVAAFADCVSSLWKNGYVYYHSGGEYQDSYDYDEEEYYYERLVEGYYDSDEDIGYSVPRNRRRKSRTKIIHLNDPYPLSMMEAKELMSEKAEDCTLAALKSHCEAREFHFLELFRANYTLGERLGLMVDVESNCKEQAKELQQKMSLKASADGGLGEENANIKYTASKVTTSPNHKLLQEEIKKSNACVKHLQSLEKSDLEERIGSSTTKSIMSHCARQAVFMKCTGLDPESLPSNMASPGLQGRVAKCIIEAKQGGPIGNMASSFSSWDKGFAQTYLTNNGVALIATLAALVFARRYFWESQERLAEVSIEQASEEPQSEEPQSQDKQAEATDDVQPDDAVMVDKKDLQVIESGDSPEKPSKSKEFYNALAKLLTKNKDQQAVFQALKIMETLIVNATTEGQTSLEDETAKKYRRVRTSNPAIKPYTSLVGAKELMLSVGFVQSLEEDDEDGKAYLTYPFGGDVPAWLDYGINKMRKARGVPPRLPMQKIKETCTAADGKDAMKMARKAALARDAERKQRSEESKEKSKKMKFAAGMGGGNSHTMFYHGGT